MDFEEKFQQRYSSLNKEQKQAVDTIEGPVLVVAGPGSGKTELLSLRVANILKKTDALPSSILCLTFTESAASNMRKRLAGLIGKEAYKVAIHTFHSLGNEIINQNPEYFYSGAFFSPLDELTQYQILEKILENLDHDDPLGSYHPDHGYSFLKDIQSHIGNLKKEGISPDRFKRIIQQNQEFIAEMNPLIGEAFIERISKKNADKYQQLLNLFMDNSKEGLSNYIYESFAEAFSQMEQTGKTPPLTAWARENLKKDKDGNKVLKDTQQIKKQLSLANVYKSYQQALKKQGYYDYDDMLMDTVEAMEKDFELKYNVQEKYLYVLVDEFQDTSGVQMRLLDNLLNMEINEGKPNILAVGDDDQSIFKFQGANIENILGFHKKYDSAETVVLHKNYRSNQQILDFIRNVILKGEDRLENRLENISKELEAGNSAIGPGEIKDQKHLTAFHQYVAVAKQIESMLAAGADINEIAIIAPKHRILEEMAKVLDYYGVSVNYERKKNLLDQKHIQQLVVMLRFLISLISKKQHEADEYLPEILSFPFWQIDKLVIWKISIEANKKRKLWLEIMLEHKDSFIRELAEFFIQLAKDSKNLTAEEVLDVLTGSSSGFSPYRDFYFSSDQLKESPHKYLDFLRSLQAFVDALRNHKSKTNINIEDLISFVDLHEKHNLPLKYESTFSPDGNALSLMTVHKAKGLEFETVFLLDCQDQVWMSKGRSENLSLPKNLTLSKSSENSDDKLRLFYVALSRAKKNLYINYYERVDNDKKEQNRLRFLEDLPEEEVQNPEQNLPELLEIKFNFHKYDFHNIQEKELLKDLVKDYKLSVTHLNNFLDITAGGPQQFLEKNLLRFPQKKSAAGSYGTAMHQSLHEMYKEFKNKGELPGVEFLLNRFETVLTSQRLNTVDHKKFLKKGLDELNFFYEKNRPNFNPYDLIEFNFDNQGVMCNNARLTGKIDLMKVDNDAKQISVIDYKTGKPLQEWDGRSEYEQIKSWRYKNQLMFYKLLVENSRDFGGKYSVEKGALDFFTPANEQLVSLNLEIDPQELEQFKRLVDVVYQKIINLDFPDIEEYEQSIMGISWFQEDLIKNKVTTLT